MIVSITSLKLKSPWHYFKFVVRGMRVMKQINETPYLKKRTIGIWLTHYTMTLWESEHDMKLFVRSGDHLTSIKESRNIAEEIKTYTYSATQLPSWKEGKILLLQFGKIIHY
jgi:hypothetical protein